MIIVKCSKCQRHPLNDVGMCSGCFKDEASCTCQKQDGYPNKKGWSRFTPD
jgi:hypothetical protein